jgi:hypothetical protein
LHIVKGKGILQSKRNSQLLPVEYDIWKLAWFEVSI